MSYSRSNSAAALVFLIDCFLVLSLAVLLIPPFLFLWSLSVLVDGLPRLKSWYTESFGKRG